MKHNFVKYGPRIACAAALILSQSAYAAEASSDANAKLIERARQIHSRIVALDSHFDLPFDYPGAASDGKTQFDLPKAERGQLKAAPIAVFVQQGPRTPQGYAKAAA